MGECGRVNVYVNPGNVNVNGNGNGNGNGNVNVNCNWQLDGIDNWVVNVKVDVNVKTLPGFVLSRILVLYVMSCHVVHRPTRTSSF